MVDRIHDRSPQSRQLDNGANSRKPETLRTNFRSLSSGLRVLDGGTPSESGRTASNDGGSTADPVVQGLNDAVSFSAKALQSLEQVSRNSSLAEGHPETVRELARDLDRLRGDINGVLEELRSKATTAEVINENVVSSETKLTDLSAAQHQAEQTGAQINVRSVQAAKAHSNLTPTRVASLLRE